MSRQFARTLRARSTDAEKLLWSRLRARRLEGVKFKRQVPLDGFIADFVALDQRLVIEVDGGQHGGQRDIVRDKALETRGFHVIRFWNNDVLGNIDGVLETIVHELKITR